MHTVYLNRFGAIMHVNGLARAVLMFSPSTRSRRARIFTSNTLFEDCYYIDTFRTNTLRLIFERHNRRSLDTSTPSRIYHLRAAHISSYSRKCMGIATPPAKHLLGILQWRRGGVVNVCMYISFQWCVFRGSRCVLHQIIRHTIDGLDRRASRQQ